MRRATVALAVAIAFAGQARAQTIPAIARGADPNDWEAWYDAGIQELNRDPSAAELAFIHASRLRPDRPEPLFARWITIWSRDVDLFGEYLRGDEKALRNPKVATTEALRRRALQRNPFVHQGQLMFLYDRLPGRFRDDAPTRGWIALGRAELPRALEIFGRLVERNPSRYGGLRFVRASAFVNIGRLDSAAAELSALLEQLRGQEAKELVSFYESKELLEYAIGLLHLQGGRVSQARDAFGRAVVENAAFAPAHAMLGTLAMTPRSIDDAIIELELALQIDSTDVQHVLQYARALTIAKRFDDAVKQARKAVALEPLYAAPYLLLATALEQSSDTVGAMEQYGEFLARSAKSDPQRSLAEKKLRARAP